MNRSLFRHFAQTRMRRARPPRRTVTVWRFGRNRRLVRGALRAHCPEWTWRICCPLLLPLPQNSQICAIWSRILPVTSLGSRASHNKRGPRAAASTHYSTFRHRGQDLDRG
jgi:hypothetical protein